MQVTRRDLALAGALALCAQGLLFGTAAHAETEAAAVDQAVEALRRALLTADQAELEKLTADQVSYGHSDGKVQTKAEFIEGVVTRKAVVKSLTFPELKVAVVGVPPSLGMSGCRNPKPTASLRLPGSASCRSGRSRTATGSSWRAGVTSSLNVPAGWGEAEN
jgi:Domain of unknown function (DUF4440)